ncbi:MAG: glycyl-radical enzyme activating protein [Desulfobacterales bacterium]|jgi:pyruvate formate lyase activating enzyme
MDIPSDTTGHITRIQRFSTHDGPGIRTTVFTKGCTLSCSWCHNPETVDRKEAVMWFEERCRLCARCASVCPENAHQVDQDGGHTYHRERCAVCGRCVDACPHRALELTSRSKKVDEILDIVVKDMPYYHSSAGGVTISGGEPLLQIPFVRAILERLRQLSVHTAVDTALNVAWDSVENLLDSVDLWLVDLKLMNPELHRKYTGVTNTRILDNLKRLSQLTKGNIIVRIPMIESVTATLENIKATVSFVKSIENVRHAELLPYHDFGDIKSKSMGMSTGNHLFKRPADHALTRAAEEFINAGLKIRLLGDTIYQLPKT